HDPHGLRIRPRLGRARGSGRAHDHPRHARDLVRAQSSRARICHGESLMLSWMAWSVPTAVFFVTILAILTGMSVLAVVAPSRPRTGLLGIPTQRGDRLFVSLLGAAFIHLGWLAVTDASLWYAFGLSLVFAALTFRFA